MSNQEILQKSIEKAVAKGFPIISPDWSVSPADTIVYNLEGKLLMSEPYSVIFSHKFAKAFFSQGYCLTEECNDRIGKKHTHENFKHHLQQMVVEEDPIKYLERFL